MYGAAMRREIDRRAITALSAAISRPTSSNGALPALLPFVVRFDLSYTEVGALMLVSALASSIVQPLFGVWSDRRGAVCSFPPASRSPEWAWRWRPPPRPTGRAWVS